MCVCVGVGHLVGRPDLRDLLNTGLAVLRGQCCFLTLRSLVGLRRPGAVSCSSSSRQQGSCGVGRFGDACVGGRAAWWVG